MAAKNPYRSTGARSGGTQGKRSTLSVVSVAPRTWFGRLVTAIVACGLVVLAVFFFTFFLAVFSILAAVIITRIVWAQRQSRRKATERVIDVEYSVEKPEAEPQEQATASKTKRLARGSHERQ